MSFLLIYEAYVILGLRQLVDILKKWTSPMQTYRCIYVCVHVGLYHEFL